jgi:cysteine-rich repeat protein
MEKRLFIFLILQVSFVFATSECQGTTESCLNGVTIGGYSCPWSAGACSNICESSEITYSVDLVNTDLVNQVYYYLSETGNCGSGIAVTRETLPPLSLFTNLLLNNNLNGIGSPVEYYNNNMGTYTGSPKGIKVGTDSCSTGDTYGLFTDENELQIITIVESNVQLTSVLMMGAYSQTGIAYQPQFHCIGERRMSMDQVQNSMPKLDYPTLCKVPSLVCNGQAISVNALDPNGMDSCNTHCNSNVKFACHQSTRYQNFVCRGPGGNAIVDAGEGCDDGNEVNGDGCSSLQVDAGWACYSGGDSEFLSASRCCLKTKTSETHACDDVSTRCKGFPPTQGSPDPDSHAECECPPGKTGVTCSCGNGIRNTLANSNVDEKCDTGINNGVQNSGCSSECQIEQGFTCIDNSAINMPDTCSRCGDGIVQYPEICDLPGNALCNSCQPLNMHVSCSNNVCTCVSGWTGETCTVQASTSREHNNINFQNVL